MSGATVVVVGGGLAGLSAAIACADAGQSVTLLESRARLGGATWSFERNGRSFDNGQHVYLRCCGAYRRFLERLGTAELAPLQERLALPVLAPGAGGPTTSWLRRSNLPAPLQLSASLMTYRHLSVVDRLRLGRAALALMSLRLTDASLDEETFAAFLSRHGQSRLAIERLWNLIALPTVNVAADEASLLLAAKVFKTGLFEEADAADLGWSTVPLGQLHGDPAARVLNELGATIRFRAKVTALSLHDGEDGEARIAGVVVDGEHLDADAVVLAVPHDVAATLLPSEAGVDNDAIAGLGRSPIVDVHYVFDRPVLEHKVMAAVDSPIQYVFDTTESSGRLTPNEQSIAISISGADADEGARPEQLIDRYRTALGELLPRTRSANVLDAVVTREHAATFRGGVGSAARRIRPATKLHGLVVAGAWTDTGWPATMEGAVRSGTASAAEVLRQLGVGRARVVRDTEERCLEEGVA